jgi:hydrogenase maturation protease
MSSQRILIACIGNIFLGDDGFGVEVAHRLLHRTHNPYPSSVVVVDFGIRGIDLAYSLLDGYDTLVLVDAIPRGSPPGTLYLIEPDLASEKNMQASRTTLDVHGMDPVKVLTFVRTLGIIPPRMLLIGCEPMHPSSGEDAEMQMGLSEPVQEAVVRAIPFIDQLIENLLSAREIEKGTISCLNT